MKRRPHCASLDIKHHPAVRFTATCKSCFISLEVFKLFATSNAARNISGRCFSRLLRFGQWSIEVRKKVHNAVFFLQGVFKHAAWNDRTLVKKMQTKENKSKRPSFSTILWLVLGTWCRRWRPRGVSSHVCDEQQVFLSHNKIFSKPEPET